MRNEDSTHIGVAEFNSNTTQTDWIVFFSHNLFGDPEMRYYTKEPPPLSGKVTPRHIAKSDNNTISITLSNLAYLNQVIVGMYQEPSSEIPQGYMRTKKITGGHGIFNDTLQFPAGKLSAGKLYITISGFNYLPFTDEIIVSPGCTKSPDIEVIAATPTLPWGGIRFKDHDVVVKTGATLTITGEVYFVPQAKLIVERGARLVLDGGTLGTACNDQWQGVEVWGAYNLPQNILNQGVVEIKNNGCITHAVFAVRAKNPSATNPATTAGGMVLIQKARFVNNKYGIALYPLSATGSGYNSYVKNSEFAIDNNYIWKFQTGYPDRMLSFEGFNVINVEGCTFRNINETQAVNNRGTAVYAFNAGVRINQLCTQTNQLGECLQYSPSLFSGWRYAVHCSNSINSHATEIANTSFIGNLRGIYLSSISVPKINNNTFITRAGSAADTVSGLYLNGCTGYSVQENTFEGNYSGSTLIYETGIVINNSGTAPNEIYNNTFTKLQNGILAQNQNRDASGEYGLTLKCNDFFYPNKYDIAVTKDNSNSGNGIKRIQGVDGSQTTDPAGNTFSYTHQNSESDYHNECENITYIYHFNTSGFRIIPTYISSSSIFPNSTSNPSITYTKSGSCPSLLNNGGGISQLKVQQDGMETNISNFTGQLLTLKDGGNTAELKEDIAYSIPPEALALYNSLMAKSPYLSESVMVEAIGKEDVLPSAMVTYILVANPQSAKSSEVNDALNSRTYLLDDEQREDVDQGVFVLSAYESLQSKLSDALAQRAQVQYAIVNHYLSDSTGSDSLKMYLAAQPDLWAKQLLLMQNIAEMDTLGADALLQAIPINSLNPSQQEEWNDMALYYGLCKQIAVNENNLPNSLQQNALAELATHISVAGSYARNLLINQGAMVYNEPYIFPDDNLKSGKVIRRKQLTNESNFQFKLFPNPASNYVIIEYDLGQVLGSPLITITDELGQLIRSISPSGVSGFQVISLSDIEPGVYLVRFSSGNKILKESKLVVVR